MNFNKTIASFCLLFSACSSGPAKLDRPDGIATSNLEDAGWYGWDTTTPRGVDDLALARLPYENLALSSPGCAQPFYGYQPPRWQERTRACRHFEQVDVSAAFSPDESQIFATQLKRHHPWENQGRGDHVVLLFANDVRSLQTQIANLLMNCKVIRNIVISTHGNLGLLKIGNVLHPTTAVFAHDITPCAFTNHSRIQVNACLQACGQCAESLRIGVQNTFLNDRFQTASGRPAFDGLQMLFSSDVTNESASRLWITESLSTERPRVRSANDLSVIYAVEHGQVSTDVPTRELATCRNNAIIPLDPRIRTRLENPYAIESSGTATTPTRSAADHATGHGAY